MFKVQFQLLGSIGSVRPQKAPLVPTPAGLFVYLEPILGVCDSWSRTGNCGKKTVGGNKKPFNYAQGRQVER